MASFTCRLDELESLSRGMAGGKAYALSELIRGGFRVPDGFVVLTSAFDLFLERSGVRRVVRAALHSIDVDDWSSLDAASSRIRALLMEARVPAEVEISVQQALADLDASPLAVRSSATLEDGGSASWAGQLTTFLGATRDDVLMPLKRCWASLYSQRAIYYCVQHGSLLDESPVAVIVQQMVTSEVAGVAFSVNPVSQDRSRIVIEAGYGLGEAVVSGRITPDTYIVDRDAWTLAGKTIGRQREALRGSQSGGSRWERLAPREREKQKLPDDEVLELAKLVADIEQWFGFPVDVEWAYDHGLFHILQSRPITTLVEQEWAASSGDRAVARRRPPMGEHP